MTAGKRNILSLSEYDMRAKPVKFCTNRVYGKGARDMMRWESKVLSNVAL